MFVQTIPSGPADNYCYLLSKPNSKTAVLIDAAEAGPILRALEKSGQELESIFITHDHHDHIGALPALKKHYPKVVIAAFEKAMLPVGISNDFPLKDLQRSIVLGSQFQVFLAPGHSANAMLLYFHDEEDENGHLFVGDNLFPMSVGRVFKNRGGLVSDLFMSTERILSFPGNTLLYSGHEYGVGNAEFALSLQPKSHKVPELLERYRRGAPSTPCLLKDELELNPFLKVFQIMWDKGWNPPSLDELLPFAPYAHPSHEEKLAAIYNAQKEALEKFTALRERKDNFPS